MKTKLASLLLAGLVLSAPLANAYPTISWQNQLFDPLELGTFDALVPTADNTGLWETSWKLLSVGNWSSGSQTFGNNFTFNPDGTVNGLAGSDTFAAGEQVYLWVRCNNEWSLVTDNSAGSGSSDIWVLPNPASDPGESITWVLNSANTPVIGGVNGIQSGTPYSYDPGTNFRLQTAVLPVPEPAGALLVAGAGLLSILGRRRKIVR
jgi:hypothetical protein